MIGDLPLRPVGVVDLAPSAHATAERPARAAARPHGEPLGSLAGGTPLDAAAARDREVADRLRQLLADPGMRVLTHRDHASGRTVMQIEDRATGETVDQIPAEDLLRLYAALRGPLVDEKA